MVRMGKQTKRWRSDPKKPLFQNETSSSGGDKTSEGKDFSSLDDFMKTPASNLMVGQLSMDLIGNVYAPTLLQLANDQVEEYAASLLEYQQSQSLANAEEEEQGKDDELEEEINMDEGTDGDMNGNNDSDATTKTSTTSTITSLPSSHEAYSYLFSTTTSITDFQQSILENTSRDFFPSTTSSSMSPKWKVMANAAKFERRMNERYGRLRPFLQRHPEIETFLRQTQRRYARGEFAPIRQGDPPLDTRASVILLFMMHRNGMKMEVTFLAALFLLVGLQPWALVLCVSIGRFLMSHNRQKRSQGWLLEGHELLNVTSCYYDPKSETDDSKPSASSSSSSSILSKEEKYELLQTPVGKPLAEDEFTKPEPVGEEHYDTILVGSGPDTLYTAALLSRTGRTVLVLSPHEDASGMESFPDRVEIPPQFRKVSFDIHGDHISNASNQQCLLAPALCTNTDAMGGIRFARIGSEADMYTTDILSIPGMGVVMTDSSSSLSPSSATSKSVPFLLHGGGVDALAQDTATYLGDGWPEVNTDENGNKTINNQNNTAANFYGACQAINSSASEYYLSKLLKGPITGTRKDSNYQECAMRFASNFLDKTLPLNAHVRSLMAGIGMRGENRIPSKTSFAVHATNVCAALSPEGFAYPIGGPKALCKALEAVIVQNGGRIVTNAPIHHFVFADSEKDDKKVDKEDQSKEDKAKDHNQPTLDLTAPNNKNNITQHKMNKTPSPRCLGVQLKDKRIISVGTHEDGAVISMQGFIDTFVFKFPDHIRDSYGTPPGLGALEERRPLMKLIFGLNGTATDLSITGADWYRLPNAELARDDFDTSTGEIRFGTIGAALDDQNDGSDSDLDNDTSGAFDNSSSNTRDKRTKPNAPKQSNFLRKGRKKKFDAGISWMKVSFPSAKDPSWTERHGDISICVVSVEADDDFVRAFETSPKVHSAIKFGQGEIVRLREKVEADLLETFPQLCGKIATRQIIGPIRMGLGHNPQRYAAKGVRPETSYPGLYVGGSDLTIGDSFSGSIVAGWMVSNAVVGYGWMDHLVLEKNITSDISQYLPNPQYLKGRNEEDILAVPFTNDVVKTNDLKMKGKEKNLDDENGKESAAEPSKEK
eukprot:CAMPEP_0184861578 /NCGR_PEP_ID=MMETSP0580-20130426/6227_1 /TAXON_ID=1118495 /ORGANISM="Dactyliosolen fragilissimus" /LENGTH=1109 /DNA_ID=CAMNT_0027359117 /DNA_START=75 /DNA_END=3404 /DNA_ORIENTATION=+